MADVWKRLGLACVFAAALATLGSSCGEAEEECTGSSCGATSCGNGTCDAGECESCPTDCKPSECETCGNGTCDPRLEDCKSCEADCGSCSQCGSSKLGAPQPVALNPECEFLDPTYCLFPFPSNYYLKPDPTSPTGLRARIPFTALPRNSAGAPLQIDDLARADGFSPLQSLALRLPGVSLERTRAPLVTSMHRSLERDSPILVVDAETGERQLIWAEYDATAKNPATQAILVRPGGAYKENRRYIAVFRNLVDFEGGKVEPADAFRAYRDCIETSDPLVEGRREAMEDILARLASFGIKRSELYLAWDFTISSEEANIGRLLHMRNESFKELPGTKTPPFTIKSVEDDPPALPFIKRVVKGSYIVPNYVRASPVPGLGRMVIDSNGLPVRQFPDYTSNFTCIIPKSAVKSDGKVVTGRGAIYGHQVLRTQAAVANANIQKLSDEHNITFCATDLLGLSEGDALTVGLVLLDGSFFPGIPDRAQQSVLNMLYLNRLMTSPTGFVSDAAFRAGANIAPVYDNREIFYYGENYGVAVGGIFMALTKETKRAAFAVGGTAFSIVLDRSQDFEPYRGIFESSYPNELDQALIFAAIQILWDRGEISGYAQHIVSDPVDDETPTKKILIHEAFADHIVPNVTTEQFARIVGAKVYSPPLDPGRSLDKIPLFGLEPMQAPFDGPAALVVWDNGSVPPPPINVAPSEGIDSHGAPGETASARRQISDFLKPDGVVNDVCGGAACKTD